MIPAPELKTIVPTAIDWEVGATRRFGDFDLGTSELVSGWAAAEDQHIWNDGPEATLRLTTGPVKRSLYLSFEGVPFISGTCSHQDVTLYVNGLRVGFWRLRESKSYVLAVMVELEQIIERDGKAILSCAIHLPNSTRPVDVGLGKDTRELGFCFRSVTLS